MLDNGNVPQLPSLSEADAADAEGFLGEMMLCFPVLGVAAFSPRSEEKPSTIELQWRSKGIEARGYETTDGFVVRAGSRAARATVPSCQSFIVDLRRALHENGVLVPDGENLRFSQDYPFASPSAAAGVVGGRSANGRTEWKTRDGRTLKELQEAAAAG